MIESMRLFIAIFLPRPVALDLGERQKQLTQASGFRWVKAEALHITLKFLGKVDRPQMGPLEEKLHSVSRDFRPFHLSLRGVGIFPSVQRPSVGWVGLEGEIDILRSLARKINECCEELGFPIETKIYRPHVTTARFQARGKSSNDGKVFCKLLDAYHSSMFDVNNIQLAQSHLSAGGSQYEILRTFPMGTSA